MVNYKILKNCLLCKKRFSVMKGENRVRYCPECQIKVDDKIQKEIAQDKIDEENAKQEEKTA